MSARTENPNQTNKKHTEGLKREKKTEKEKEDACTLWRDTRMFDGGTSQEVDYKKLTIHNLEDTPKNTDLKSGSGPLCTCSVKTGKMLLNSRR